MILDSSRLTDLHRQLKSCYRSMGGCWPRSPPEDLFVRDASSSTRKRGTASTYCLVYSVVCRSGFGAVQGLPLQDKSATYPWHCACQACQVGAHFRFAANTARCQVVTCYALGPPPSRDPRRQHIRFLMRQHATSILCLVGDTLQVAVSKQNASLHMTHKHEVSVSLHKPNTQVEPLLPA